MHKKNKQRNTKKVETPITHDVLKYTIENIKLYAEKYNFCNIWADSYGKKLSDAEAVDMYGIENVVTSVVSIDRQIESVSANIRKRIADEVTRSFQIDNYEYADTIRYSVLSGLEACDENDSRLYLLDKDEIQGLKDDIVEASRMKVAKYIAIQNLRNNAKKSFDKTYASEEENDHPMSYYIEQEGFIVGYVAGVFAVCIKFQRKKEYEEYSDVIYCSIWGKEKINDMEMTGALDFFEHAKIYTGDIEDDKFYDFARDYINEALNINLKKEISKCVSEIGSHMQ